MAWLSTWVGYQVGLIGDGLEAIGRGDVSAYGTFMSSVLYSSYSWLAMVLVFGIVLMRRDYGPMLRAERRARRTGAVLGENARPLQDDVGLLDDDGHKSYRARLAVAPVLATLLGTVAALWYSGRAALLAEGGPAGLAEHGIRDIFAAADPATSLLLAVTVGCIVAIGLAVATRTLSLADAMDSWTDGVKAMVPALIILILAWSLSAVCEQLDTAGYLVGVSQKVLSAHWLPAVVFVLAFAFAAAAYARRGIRLFLRPLLLTIRSVPTIAVILLALIDLWSIPGGGSVANLAHLGGMLAGFIFLRMTIPSLGGGIGRVAAGRVERDHLRRVETAEARAGARREGHEDRARGRAADARRLRGDGRSAARAAHGLGAALPMADLLLRRGPPPAPRGPGGCGGRGSDG